MTCYIRHLLIFFDDIIFGWNVNVWWDKKKKLIGLKLYQTKKGIYVS